MAPFSVIVFGVVVWTIAVSGTKQLRFRLKTDNCGPGLSDLHATLEHQMHCTHSIMLDVSNYLN